MNHEKSDEDEVFLLYEQRILHLRLNCMFVQMVIADSLVSPTKIENYLKEEYATKSSSF